MSTTSTTTDEQKLRTLVERIARHQKTLGLTDVDFVSRYQRHLSSTRTWRQRLVNGDLKELKLEKWIVKLQRMVSEIDSAVAIEDFYDLPISREIRSVYNLLQGQTNDRRCAVVLGPTGVGKSFIAKKLVAENPSTTAFFETRCDSTPYHLVRGVARAVGAPEVGGIGMQTDALFEFLKGRTMTVFIDEGHEAGVHLFKLIKSAINQTPTKWMLFAYPTQWRRLITASSGAWSEAQQLLGRTLKPVIDGWSDGVHREDVAAYLRAAAPELADDADSLAGAMTNDIRAHGNFRLLADALDTARMVADANGADITPEAVREQIANLIPHRK
jgi:hypothetical protein